MYKRCLESLGWLLGTHVVHEEVAGLEFDPDTDPQSPLFESGGSV